MLTNPTLERAVPDMPGELVPEQVSNYLKTKVSQILHTRYNQFPGSQPVSMAREHLYKNLMDTDYLACEKSDGLRVLMFVLINQDTGEEGTFLINREDEYYVVPGFHFPRTAHNFDSSHNGTILDGELIYSTNPNTGIREIRYLIFDCLAMDMVSVMHKNLYKRLYHAQHEFHRPYMELRRAFPEACSHFPFKIDFKNMTQPFKIDKIFKEMKNLTYVSDGLVLTCCDTPYHPGTDSTLLKWKPAEDNTIDFKVKLEFPKYIDKDLPDHDPNREYLDYDAKPEFKLFVWKGGRDPHEDETPDENISRNGGEYRSSFQLYEDWHVSLDVSDDQWEEMKSNGESFNGRIGECYRTKEGKWRLLRWRDDKLNGNHINVVLKILKSIEDGVTEQELVAAEPDIKKRWIERENIKKQRQKQFQQQQQMQHHQHSSSQFGATPKSSSSSPFTQQRPPPYHNYAPGSRSGSTSERKRSESHEFEVPKYTSDHNEDDKIDANIKVADQSNTGDDDKNQYQESDGFEEAPKYSKAELEK
ncbi:hypothetical protein HII12_000698 [Brettanomyces bruxellensis]|uniref:mRNA-capping enzyme subunit alpha n=1 Tax=Dekkera bruxellensis TaxID=5007 RepID=A0A8H6BQA2_DEKBR|nr:hypothetical protein HII12_000698 [Brettanomyces bruxellensis]